MKKAMILTAAVIFAIFAGSACAKTPVKTPIKTPEKIIQCTNALDNYEYLECIQKNNEIYEKQINKVYSELKIK